MAKAELVNGELLTVAANTEIDFSEYLSGTKKRDGKEQHVIKLTTGKIGATLPEKYTHGFKIGTSNCIAGVRGTTFFVEFNPDEVKTTVLVTKGMVEVLNLALPDIVQILHAGEYTVISGDKAPRVPKPITDELEKLKFFLDKPIALFLPPAAAPGIMAPGALAEPPEAPVLPAEPQGLQDPGSPEAPPLVFPDIVIPEPSGGGGGGGGTEDTPVSPPRIPGQR